MSSDVSAPAAGGPDWGGRIGQWKFTRPAPGGVGSDQWWARIGGEPLNLDRMAPSDLRELELRLRAEGRWADAEYIARKRAAKWRRFCERQNRGWR